MQRKFVIGDIHGNIEKLLSCLQQVTFDYENDILISLGDIVDRGSDSYACIEELLKIKNLIPIRGNHDQCWFTDLKTGNIGRSLYQHGAKETHASYKVRDIKPEIHFDFFNNQLNYYIDESNNLFIHGGFNRHYPLSKQAQDLFCWDRDLWNQALSYESSNKFYPFKIKEKFKNIFIGHTPTCNWSSNEVMAPSGIILTNKSPITTPMLAVNIWNIDTGCAKWDYGRLTIMDVETKDYWQS
jgi:serine/threonine protein phosphatase 1